MNLIDKILPGTGLNEARSDHACAEVQVDAVKKGIVAAGGYRTDGAWMKSVEFFDYEKGIVFIALNVSSK